MSLNGYSVNIRLALVWTEFFLVPHVDTWKALMCSTCIFLIKALDIERTGFGGDGVDFLHSRPYIRYFVLDL